MHFTFANKETAEREIFILRIRLRTKQEARSTLEKR
jgi:hypothetical protein